MNKKSLFIVFAILIMAVGFIIRVTLFMSGRALWHDECSLAINILTRNPFQFLSPLEHLQSAPPIFMGLTKILTYIFKTNEYSLRIIPLLASLGSVPLFFLLSTKIFRKKYTQLIAIFLFVINFQLTYYAQEFKQYSLDTFMTILCIYLLSHKELKTMSIRNTILYGIIFALIPLISFPSAFVLIAYYYSTNKIQVNNHQTGCYNNSFSAYIRNFILCKCYFQYKFKSKFFEKLF